MEYRKTDPQAPDCMDCTNHDWVHGGFMEPPEPPEPHCTKLDVWVCRFGSPVAMECRHFERSKRCCECIHGEVKPAPDLKYGFIGVHGTVWCRIIHNRMKQPTITEIVDSTSPKCTPLVRDGFPYNCEYDRCDPCDIGCDEFDARDVPTMQTVDCEGFTAGE